MLLRSHVRAAASQIVRLSVGLAEPFVDTSTIHPSPVTAHRSCHDGAAGESRTPDPLITNQVLYQLSYCGKWRWFYAVFWARGLRPASDALAAELGRGR